MELTLADSCLSRTAAPSFMEIWQIVQSLTLRPTEAAWRTDMISTPYKAPLFLLRQERLTLQKGERAPLATATAAISSCSGHSVDIEFCCNKKRNGITWWLTVDTRRCRRFRLSPAELVIPEVSAERSACIHVLNDSQHSTPLTVVKYVAASQTLHIKLQHIYTTTVHRNVYSLTMWLVQHVSCVQKWLIWFYGALLWSDSLTAVPC